MKIEIVRLAGIDTDYTIAYVDGEPAVIGHWSLNGSVCYFYRPYPSSYIDNKYDGTRWHLVDGNWTSDAVISPAPDGKFRDMRPVWDRSVSAPMSDEMDDDVVDLLSSVPEDLDDDDDDDVVEDAWFTELLIKSHYNIVDAEDGEFLAQGIQGCDAMRHAWPEGALAFEIGSPCTCGADDPDSDKECTCDPVDVAG